MIKKQYLVIIGILAILLLASSVMALTVPGQKNSLNYIPVYQDGKIISYIAEMPGELTPVQVSPTRTNYVDPKGKVRYYSTIVKQGSSNSVISPDPDTGFTSPYPESWDPTLMKFTQVEYTTYCLKFGIPARGTFAINLKSGGWMR